MTPVTPIYLPLLALRSGVRIDGTLIDEKEATTIDLTLHDRSSVSGALRRGQVVVAGVIDDKATGIVVTGAEVSSTPGEAGKVNVAAGSLYDRTEEEAVEVPAKTKLALKAADAKKDRTSKVVVKASDGAASVIDGTLPSPAGAFEPIGDRPPTSGARGQDSRPGLAPRAPSACLPSAPRSPCSAQPRPLHLRSQCATTAALASDGWLHGASAYRHPPESLLLIPTAQRLDVAHRQLYGLASLESFTQ